MDFMEILVPVLWFALLGGVFALLLAIAARVFAVKTDPRIGQMQEALPGANCGGCGYSGCAAYAEAIAKGEASVNLCAAGGTAVARRLAAVMGVEAGEIIPHRAVILCSAEKSEATMKYLYEGARDCVSATRLGAGERLCEKGCIGLGSCAAACAFGAIKMKNGLAWVDPEVCTGCGTCVKACPKHIIRMVPTSKNYIVSCSSTENGKLTRLICTKGCIGCRICEKKCEVGAVTVTNNLASINYDLCTNCGACAAACPRHIIVTVGKVEIA